MSSAWRVVGDGARDFGRCPGLLFSFHTDRHPVARQYSDTRSELSFSRRADSPSRVVGRLVQAHHRAAGDWIAFYRYLNELCDLEWLLGSGAGILAEGPSFLMTAYAGVLQEFEMRPRLTAPTRPRIPVQDDAGVTWVEEPAIELATLIVAGHFLVAESFVATRTDKPHA